MKTVDLFAGCGGLYLGFQNAGFTLVAAFDNWQPAIEVYQNNFSHPIFNLDLSSHLAEDLIRSFNPDIIIGGPPCQDFSSAGKRDENLGRANLTLAFTDLVCSIRPQWFIMENVERIVKSNILSIALNTFKHSNYGLSSAILNASYCGVPQVRKRYFLIGELEGQDNLLNYYLEKNQAAQPLTVYDYLGHELGIEYYYRHPRSYKRRAIFSIYEPSPTIRGVNRPIPKTYQKHPGDRCDTLDEVRPLTTIERSYIQTFPQNFRFFGNKSDLEQMIGNAVPVKLAEYVALALVEYRQQKASRQLSLF